MRRRDWLLLPLLPALAGCGLRPLYGGAGHAVAEELGAIEVVAPKTPLGWLLADRLVGELAAVVADVPRYRLEILRLRRRRDALAVQLDDSVTRYELTLIAEFQLTRLADGARLLRADLRRVASYNVLRQPWATRAAERDAERRAAGELARAIRNRLALYFARQV